MILPHLHILTATAMLPNVIGGIAPLGYLRGFGPKTYPVTALTWGLLSISIIVVVIITALVIVGVMRRASSDREVQRVPVRGGPNGLSWIVIGVGISTFVLFGSIVWTMVVLADINSPHQKPAFTVEVTGQQWWWSARYLGDQPSRILTTANEIHIPVGKPVRVKLLSADVIHSFWVPALTGKTELIPGLTNYTWLEASRPGVYAGQCSEYCGAQHAHMGFLVVAQKPADFKAWFDAQLKAAAAPASQDAIRGEKEFVNRCGVCHTVRGTDAHGILGPDLTHVMSRKMLASNTLRNTPANLAGWIADPQAQKPGTKMPDLYLSGPQLNGILTYVRTLK
jgi:cytochrome c oxidase subunit 2